MTTQPQSPAASAELRLRKIVESVADQQAMPDDSWRIAFEAALRELSASKDAAQGDEKDWRLDNLKIAISTVVDYISSCVDSCVDSDDDAAQLKYRAKVALGYAKEAQSLLADWLRQSDETLGEIESALRAVAPQIPAIE